MGALWTPEAYILVRGVTTITIAITKRRRRLPLTVLDRSHALAQVIPLSTSPCTATRSTPDTLTVCACLVCGG
eukprot:3119094-Pleurochrysis_carterae.AAC.1